MKLSTAAAKKHHASLVTTSDASNADTQATNLGTWVTQKVPAIVSFPMVFEATEAIAKRALDAGLIWVTYGGTLEHQSADIQFSFLKGGTLLGEAAAKWANDHLGGKGNCCTSTKSSPRPQDKSCSNSKLDRRVSIPAYSYDLYREPPLARRKIATKSGIDRRTG